MYKLYNLSGLSAANLSISTSAVLSEYNIHQSGGTFYFIVNAIHLSSDARLCREMGADQGAAGVNGRSHLQRTSRDVVFQPVQGSIEVGVRNSPLRAVKERRPHMAAGYFASFARVPFVVILGANR